MKTTLFLATAMLSFGCGKEDNACEELAAQVSECTGAEVPTEDEYSDEELEDCQESLDNWEVIEPLLCPDGSEADDADADADDTGI